MADSMFNARSGFDGLLAPVAVANAGVTAQELDGCGLATIRAHKGHGAALRDAVAQLYGIALPAHPRIVGSGDVRFLATGPEAWLALHKTQSNRFASDLAREVGTLAAICDQSDAYAVLGLRGPKVRSVLAKGFTIDLHPSKFGPGAAAVTIAAHIGAILWRPISTEPGTFDFELAVYRSYAASFSHWLCDSAAEYGLAVQPPEAPMS